MDAQIGMRNILATCREKITRDVSIAQNLHCLALSSPFLPPLRLSSRVFSWSLSLSLPLFVLSVRLSRLRINTQFQYSVLFETPNESDAYSRVRALSPLTANALHTPKSTDIHLYIATYVAWKTTRYLTLFKPQNLETLSRFLDRRISCEVSLNLLYETSYTSLILTPSLIISRHVLTHKDPLTLNHLFIAPSHTHLRKISLEIKNVFYSSHNYLAHYSPYKSFFFPPTRDFLWLPRCREM